jgi:hypothetical protein
VWEDAAGRSGDQSKGDQRLSAGDEAQRIRDGYSLMNRGRSSGFRGQRVRRFKRFKRFKGFKGFTGFTEFKGFTVQRFRLVPNQVHGSRV